MPIVPDPVPLRPVMRPVTGHVGASAPTTDQKVGGSNPFGRTIVALALTSANGQG